MSRKRGLRILNKAQFHFCIYHLMWRARDLFIDPNSAPKARTKTTAMSAVSAASPGYPHKLWKEKLFGNEGENLFRTIISRFSTEVKNK